MKIKQIVCCDRCTVELQRVLIPGHVYLCDGCKSDNRRFYREQHKDYIRSEVKNHYHSNKNKYILKSRKRYVITKQKQAQYAVTYRKEKRHIQVAYRKKWLSIPRNRLAQNLRGRIYGVLKGYNKSASSISLIGCSFKTLKEYLEKQFKPGMTWENYGRGKNKWSVDHIIPCITFDLQKEEEQRKCFHYTNLQPLWCSENSSKGGRLFTIVSTITEPANSAA